MSVLNAVPVVAELALTTRVLLDESAWDAIRADWEALHAASPSASTALDFIWLRNWWQVYAATLAPRSLRIVTLWRGTQLIGAIPLYLRRARGGVLGLRCLGFVSTGEAEFEETCPDYLNLLSLPGEEALCARRIWRAVESMAWDKVELLDMPESTALLTSSLAPSRLRRFARGKCPIADLAGGFEAYLARLSPNSRQQARRLLREAGRAGVQFELVAADRLDAAFDDLVRLHQQRWTAVGKPGVFAAPRFVEFHLRLLRQLMPLQRVALARLSLDGDAFAVLYGFISGARFEFYQSGIRHDVGAALQSPGNLAHLLLMQALAARGIVAYDFLRGSASYKERLATRDLALVGAHAWRPTLRTAAFRSVHLAGRVARRGWRLWRQHEARRQAAGAHRRRATTEPSLASTAASSTAPATRGKVRSTRVSMIWLAALCAITFAPTAKALPGTLAEAVHAPAVERGCDAKEGIDLARIHGRIQIVESFPDYKVKVVESFADLHVQVVESFPDQPGKWKLVESFPDHKVQFVESFPDFTIKYVQSFPGVQ